MKQKRNKTKSNRLKPRKPMKSLIHTAAGFCPKQKKRNGTKKIKKAETNYKSNQK